LLRGEIFLGPDQMCVLAVTVIGSGVMDSWPHFYGFAAKEVVVSTLGTVYSLGKVEPDASESLADRRRNEPNWNALTALSLIVFVMLYAPCFVTLVVMRRETGSWKWPAFAMGYSTVLAYVVAFTVSSIGFLGN